MMLRPDRSRRDGDRTLPQRMAIFVAGAVLALTGIIWNQGTLVWIAIAVMAAGMMLSVYDRRRRDHPGRNGAE